MNKEENNSSLSPHALFFLIHGKVSNVEHFLKLNADIKSYLRFGNSENPLPAWFLEIRCVAPEYFPSSHTLKVTGKIYSQVRLFKNVQEARFMPKAVDFSLQLSEINWVW